DPEGEFAFRDRTGSVRAAGRGELGRGVAGRLPHRGNQDDLPALPTRQVGAAESPPAEVAGDEVDGRPPRTGPAVEDEVRLTGAAHLAGEGHHLVRAVAVEVLDPLHAIEDVALGPGFPEPLAGGIISGQAGTG